MSFSIAGIAFFGGIAAIIRNWRKKHADQKGGIVLTSAQKASWILLGKLPNGKAVEKAMDKIDDAMEEKGE